MHAALLAYSAMSILAALWVTTSLRRDGANSVPWVTGIAFLLGVTWPVLAASCIVEMKLGMENKAT